MEWVVPLPAGLHVLTAAADGEAKLWLAHGGGSSSGGDSSTGSAAAGAVCCTLLPEPGDRQADCCLRCRPAVVGDGAYIVCGGPSGSLACWDLAALQRQAHLPLNPKHGNAAAVLRGVHAAPVTAVAASCEGGWVLASGDASGRLAVCWR